MTNDEKVDFKRRMMTATEDNFFAKIHSLKAHKIKCEDAFLKATKEKEDSLQQLAMAEEITVIRSLKK
jgi:hypothetical protein